MTPSPPAKLCDSGPPISGRSGDGAGASETADARFVARSLRPQPRFQEADSPRRFPLAEDCKFQRELIPPRRKIVVATTTNQYHQIACDSRNRRSRVPALPLYMIN